MKAAIKVAITDHPFPSTQIEEKALKGIGAEMVLGNCSKEEEVLRLAGDADAVLVTYAPITWRVIDGLSRCRIISRCGIGLDNIDVPAATRRGIVVTNVPDYCVDEVAEHALALLMGCARRIALLDRSVHEGEWDYRQFRPFFRLRGKTLGLLGFGKIGRALTAKVQALGLRVIVHDPYVSEDSIRGLGCTLTRSRDDLFRNADFISIHVPLTPETRGAVGARELNLMKSTAFLINTARAEIIDEDALFKALTSGRPAGAGLDLLARTGKDNPLLSLPQVTVTPHAAFYSEESTVELQTRAVGEVVRVFSGQPPLCPVNPEVLKP